MIRLCHALVPLAGDEQSINSATMVDFIIGLLGRPTTCNTVAAPAFGGIEVLICGFDEREHCMVILRYSCRHTYTYRDMSKHIGT